MSILNYTTQISVDKTTSEISAMLAEAKASAIMSEYSQGVISGLSFRIPTEFGEMTFRLPARMDRILAVMLRDRKIPNGLKNKEQAARVAWRIIKDGLAAQLAWVNAGLVTIEAVFLAYAQGADGKTLHERLTEKRFEGLALPAPRS